MNFDICIPVWGRYFVDQFTEITLPTHLAEGNLPFLCRQGKVTYHLCTTSEDYARLQDAPVVRRLGQYADVSFHFFETAPSNPVDSVPDAIMSKYGVANGCFKSVMQGLDPQEDPIFMPMNADMALSTGFFAGVFDLLASGKQAVLTTTFSCNRETCGPILLRDFLDPTTGVISISPRQLVALGTKQLHSFTRGQFWDSPISCAVTSLLHWDIPDHGLITHSYHFAPVAIALHDLGPAAGQYDHTIDTSFAFENFRDPEKIGLLDDSDRGFFLEFCSMDYRRTTAYEPEARTPEKVGEWIASGVEVGIFNNTAMHLQFARRPHRTHHADLDAAWYAQETEALAVIDAINDVVTRELAARAQVAKTALQPNAPCPPAYSKEPIFQRVLRQWKDAATKRLRQSRK